MDTPIRREVRSDALRRNLRPLLNAVEREHEHVLIKRYDDDTAVIVPVHWYRIATAICGAVHTVTRDADGKCLPDDAALTVGDLHSAIGEATLAELRAQTPEGAS
jgi:hypothetical protein